MAALRKLVDRKVIRGHERVVVISTANGLKFADQKIAYHAGTLPEANKELNKIGRSESSADPKTNQRCDFALRRAHAAARELMSDGQPRKRDVAGDPATETAKGIGRAAGDGKPLGFSTLAVHGGEPRPKLGNSFATPIVQTATYTFANTQELHDHFQRRIEREEYGRYGNPTQRIAEQKLPRWKARKIACFFPAAWPR